MEKNVRTLVTSKEIAEKMQKVVEENTRTIDPNENLENDTTSKVDEIKVRESIAVMRNLWHAATKVRSIRRAMKRGHLTEYGILISKRPFNNRANTSKRPGVHSRFVNVIKHRDYETAKSAAARESV